LELLEGKILPGIAALDDNWMNQNQRNQMSTS
jgi:hypothetical protein